LLWNFFFNRSIQLLVLEEHDRVVVADGRLEQTLGVIRGRRSHNHQSGAMDEPAGVALRVIKAAAYAAAITDANRDGASLSACAAIAQLGSLLGDRIDARRDEIDKLDLGHRPHSRQCSADGGTNDHAFSEGRVDDPRIAKFFEQAFGSFESAAHSADVLA